MNDLCVHKSGYKNAKFVKTIGEANFYRCVNCGAVWNEATLEHVEAIRDTKERLRN